MKLHAWTSALVLTALLLAPTAAHAQTGSAATPVAFDDTVPQVIIAQAGYDASQIQFLSAVQTASGSATFAPVFTIDTLRLNAIAFNPVDRFVYGYVQKSATSAIPAGSIVRVGKNGVAARVGTGIFRDGEGSTLLNAGDIDASGTYYLHRSDSGSRTTTVERVDLTTGRSLGITSFTAPGVTGVSDLVALDGFLLGLGADGRFVRFDMATATVRYFAAPAAMPRGTYGGAWLYGNGNLGLSLNTGGIYQVKVANLASTPVFSLVSVVSGPGSHNNDGTSIPAAPVDLAVSEAAALDPADPTRVNYTVTVTNNGVGTSSGHTVTGPLGTDLTAISSSDAACTSAAGLSCTSGPLAVGESRSYRFSGVVAAPTAQRTVVHAVTVLGNESDPVAANDTATATVVTPAAVPTVPVPPSGPTRPTVPPVTVPVPSTPVEDVPAEDVPAEDEPAEDETPAPQVPETPATGSPAPQVPETPATETPAPQVPETPATETPATPQVPEVPEIPTSETPAPQAPEAPESPATPVVILPGADGPLVDPEPTSPTPTAPAPVAEADSAEATAAADTAALASTGGSPIAAVIGIVLLMLGAIVLFLRRRIHRP